MIWDAEYIGAQFKLKVQDIVDALTKILDYIFGFIADDQGWNTAE